jgi:hypothetical protein
MSRELEHEEPHPCTCDERYAVFSNEDFEWMKRSLYVSTRYYFCRRCDAEWRIEEWCQAQSSRIIIDREPFAEEEE